MWQSEPCRACDDDEGRVYRMERADGTMIMNEINTDPAEIERTSMAHPVACDAVAAGVNDGTQEPAGARARQLMCSVKLAFEVPAPLELGRLDAWLGDVLGLDIQRQPLQGGAQGTRGADVLARAWLDRGLLLSCMLLQGGRIPVFERPRIVVCQPVSDRQGHWRAHTVFARVDEMSVSAYEIALKAAFELNVWAMAHAADAENLQAFYTRIEKGVLPRLKAVWGAGKSTLPVLRAAYQRAIPFTHLGAGVFQLGWGSKAQRIDRSVTGRDSAFGAKLTVDKALTASLLRRAGLPAPVHGVVADLKAALNVAHQIGWPVVVKPADRERGEGVVVDVCDDERLTSAFEAAWNLSRARKVIVERQVQGVCHRLFMANGRLLYAVKRMPMSVEGDGVHDVSELIDAEVARQLRLAPWDRSGIQPLDDLARAEIARCGHTPQSVPSAGERIPLRRIESTEWGGVDVDVTQRIHPENLRVASAATALFGLSVAGIDIITADISRPWFENGAIVNEVNFAPLLGGGAISRSCLPAFLGGLVDGTGMIPVEVFAGGEAAWAAGERRWKELLGTGAQAYLSDEQRTLMHTGDEWRMAAAGLYHRARAMVLSTSVQALVLVVKTDELLTTGFPLEVVRAVTIVDHAMVSFESARAVPRERLEVLLNLLWSWSMHGAL